MPVAYLATPLRNEGTFTAFLRAASDAGLALEDASGALRMRGVRFAHRLPGEGSLGRVLLTRVTLRV
jgi:hypothetical protein